jgi:hypothetical protein
MASLGSINTPLAVLGFLNVINYIFVHTFVVERWNNKSPHEITFIKENIK